MTPSHIISAVIFLAFATSLAVAYIHDRKGQS